MEIHHGTWTASMADWDSDTGDHSDLAFGWISLDFGSLGQFAPYQFVEQL